MKVLVYGEILWDIIEGEPHLGGAPLNFAAHIVQCGGRSAIVSALGNDSFGEKALSKISKIGVDTSWIQKNDKKTGFVPVTLKNGEPEYEIIKDVAYDYITIDDLPTIKSFDFNTFYLGTLIQRNGISEETLYHLLNKYTFQHIFYDVNLRKDSFSKSIIEKSLTYCTILKLNDIEVVEIGKLLYNMVFDIKEFCIKVTSEYSKIKIVVITAGKEGSYIYQNNILTKVPTQPVNVVDTVGAGDAFCAAFLTRFAKTGDAIEAAKIGNKVAAFVASSAGPIPKYNLELVSNNFPG